MMIPQSLKGIYLADYSFVWQNTTGNAMPSVTYPSNIKSGDLIVWIHGYKPTADNVTSSLSWQWIAADLKNYLTFGCARRGAIGNESGSVGHNLSASVGAPKFSSMFVFRNNEYTWVEGIHVQTTSTTGDIITMAAPPTTGKLAAIAFQLRLAVTAPYTETPGWVRIHSESHINSFSFSLFQCNVDNGEAPPVLELNASQARRNSCGFYIRQKV